MPCLQNYKDIKDVFRNKTVMNTLLVIFLKTLQRKMKLWKFEKKINTMTHYTDAGNCFRRF